MPYRLGPAFALLLVFGLGLVVANNTISLTPTDKSQLSAGGVLAFFWEDFPESENVEDRRGEEGGWGTSWEDDTEIVQSWQPGYGSPDVVVNEDPEQGPIDDCYFDGTCGGGEPVDTSDPCMIYGDCGPDVPYIDPYDTSVCAEDCEPEYADPRSGDIDEDDAPDDAGYYQWLLYGDDVYDDEGNGPRILDPYDYQEEITISEEKPWYVQAFPGFGSFFQNIIPGAPRTISVAAPAPTPVYTPPPRVQYAQPSCWISANPMEVAVNGSTMLQWNAYHATRASLSGIGEVAVSGSRRIHSITSERTYTLTVAGQGGSSSCYTRISVRAPARLASCIISAYPDVITRGNSANLAWGSENASRATLSGTGSVNVRGGIYVKPTQTSDYTLTVYNAEGRPNSCTARILVR